MAVPRFFHPEPLQAGAALALSASAARHVQVLRLQPGARIVLFDGRGGEYAAVVERIGRSDVRVEVGAHDPVEREAAREVHLAVGMPANDRMDWLVEKATELGAASIQPLVTERGVLRLSSERAEKKRAHWHAIAVAACEQCGRNRVPVLHRVRTFAEWLAASSCDGAPAHDNWLLSLRRDTASSHVAAGPAPCNRPLRLLNGPEGGLDAAEEAAALAAGFAPISLGARVLRTETAALAALARFVVE